MTLARHNQKHNFSKTKAPETTIEKSQEEFIFVVQNKNVGTGPQFLFLQTLQTLQMM